MDGFGYSWFDDQLARAGWRGPACSTAPPTARGRASATRRSTWSTAAAASARSGTRWPPRWDRRRSRKSRSISTRWPGWACSSPWEADMDLGIAGRSASSAPRAAASAALRDRAGAGRRAGADQRPRCRPARAGSGRDRGRDRRGDPRRRGRPLDRGGQGGCSRRCPSPTYW